MCTKIDWRKELVKFSKNNVGLKTVWSFHGERYADPSPPPSLRLSKVAVTVLGLADFSTTFSVLPDFDENLF